MIKKTRWLPLVLLLILVFGNMQSAFADAVLYDMEPAGYHVYVATPDGGLNMRHGPGSGYSKVMQKRIPDNEKLYIEYISGKWGFTTFEGNNGWVYLPQTTTTKPSTNEAELPNNEPAVPDVSPDAPEVDVSMPETLPEEEPSDLTAKTGINQLTMTILLIAGLLVVINVITIVLLLTMNSRKKKG